MANDSDFENMVDLDTKDFYYNYSYDYAYEMTEEEIVESVLVTTCYSIIFLLGVIGNSLVIFCVAKYKRMQSITNQLLLSLACADLLLTLICVPIRLAKLFSYEWIFGAALCYITHYVQTMSMVTSIMTLTAISLERYYAISRPLRAKYICTANHARSVIVAIWIAASVLSLPILFVQKHHAMGLGEPVFWCNKDFSDRKGQLLVITFEVYMLTLLFLLPVITMAIAYAGVCIELWAVTENVAESVPNSRKYSKNSNKMDTSRSLEGQVRTSVPELANETLLNKIHNRDVQVRRQVLKMLFIVVIIFILCWCPLLAYNLAVAAGTIDPYIPSKYPYAKPMSTAFSLMAYCNSCLNPIVYGFMSRYFRKSFKQALSLCCILKSYKQRAYFRKTFVHTDRSSSSLRKPGTEAMKATITTMAADSSLSRSPPISPNNSYPRQI